MISPYLQITACQHVCLVSVTNHTQHNTTHLILLNWQCLMYFKITGCMASICETYSVVLKLWKLKKRSYWTEWFAVHCFSRCHVIWDLILECLGIAGPFFACLGTNIPGKPKWILRSRMNVSHAVTEQVLPLGVCKSFVLSHHHVFPSF